MPKIVNHDEKKKIIAETAWEIIRTEGTEKASVRNIAAKAGISTGALKHYFSTQDELLLFITDYFLALGKERTNQITWSKDPLDAVKAILMELVPVSEEKRTETSVWLTFAIRSLSSAALRMKKDELTEGEYILMDALLEILMKAGYIQGGINIEIEKLRLSALIEGLAIQALLRPDIFTYEKTEQVIAHHLNELCS